MIRFLRDADVYKKGMERELGSAEAAFVTAGDAITITRANPTTNDVQLRYDPDTGAIIAQDGQGTVAVASKVLVPNNRIAVLGDSYDANGFATVVNGVATVYEGNSGVLAMNEALGCPWDIGYQGAISGTSTADWLSNAAQFAAVLASDSYHVWVGFPNNDAQLIGNAATTITNLTSIYAQLAAAGKKIKVTTRGSLAATWTVAQYGIAKQISDFIVATAKANGWPIMDIENSIYDPATGKGVTALMLTDTNHPTIPAFFFAAQQSLLSFAAEVPRPAQRQNAPTNNLYNSALVGTVANSTTPGTATIPGFANYNTGGSQTLALSQVARVDTQGQNLLRFQLTSAAAGDRQGLHQVISISAAWSSSSPAVGTSIVDSNGNRQRVITAGGATGGSAPTWKTAIGDTTTDGSVVWERVPNIIAGTSKINIKLDYDIGSVSGGDLSCQAVMICNFTGGTPASMRAHSTGSAAATPGQRHTMTKTRRPALMTPTDFVVPTGTTALDLYVYFMFSAASVTATADMYGLEVRIS